MKGKTGMEEKKIKTVTTEMILKKKGLIDKTPEPFYSNLFGGNIIIENTHPREFMELLTVMANGADDEMYAYSRLMYENCPLFRDKKLLEEYEIDDPYLLPKKIYGANIVEFMQLGNAILEAYGNDIESLKKIKKK